MKFGQKFLIGFISIISAALIVCSCLLLTSSLSDNFSITKDGKPISELKINDDIYPGKEINYEIEIISCISSFYDLTINFEGNLNNMTSQTNLTIKYQNIVKTNTLSNYLKNKEELYYFLDLKGDQKETLYFNYSLKEDAIIYDESMDFIIKLNVRNFVGNY